MGSIKKFQIRNVLSDWCWSYFYTNVEDDEDPVKKCCDLADEKLDRLIANWYGVNHIKEVLICVEYDQEKKKAKRWWLKFKIERWWFTVWYTNWDQSKYVTWYKFKKYI